MSRGMLSSGQMLTPNVKDNVDVNIQANDSIYVIIRFEVNIAVNAWCYHLAR
jgi:hypothetical protein